MVELNKEVIEIYEKLLVVYLREGKDFDLPIHIIDSDNITRLEFDLLPGGSGLHKIIKFRQYYNLGIYETFKEGDKIQALINRPSGGIVCANEIGSITSIESHTLYVSFPSQTLYEVCINNVDFFRNYKILPRETTKTEHKFKVGDWVKIVKPGKGCSPECIGEVVQILKLGLYKNKGLGYKTTKTKNSSNAITGALRGFIGEESFKLADKPIEFIPEVGDMLIALVDGPDSCPESVKKGDKGIIIKIHDKDVEVDFPNFDGYYCNKHRIGATDGYQLVKKKDIKTDTSEIKKETVKYKDGDWVVLKNASEVNIVIDPIEKPGSSLKKLPTKISNLFN